MGTMTQDEMDRAYPGESWDDARKRRDAAERLAREQAEEPNPYTQAPFDLSTYSGVYHAAMAADAAWSRALHAKFGNRAGDVRYTKEATEGEFAPLYAAFKATSELLRNFPREVQP